MVNPQLEPIPDFSADAGTLLRWLGEASAFLGDMERAFPVEFDSDQASLIGGLRWKGRPTPHQMRAALEYIIRQLGGIANQ